MVLTNLSDGDSIPFQVITKESLLAAQVLPPFEFPSSFWLVICAHLLCVTESFFVITLVEGTFAGSDGFAIASRTPCPNSAYSL